MKAFGITAAWSRPFFLAVCLGLSLLVSAAANAAEKRVALVVGNSNYPSGALENPVNDASAVAAALQRLGFDVMLRHNANKSEFDTAMKLFGNKAEKAEVAIIFYAGHGIQVNGYNYLVPIDARPQSERDLKREMVKLDDVIDDMGSAKIKLIFFDACRDNPLTRSFTRGGSRGLAPPIEASGTLISFATKHGNTASDGEGKHSPYTESLLAELVNPNTEVERLLKTVSQNVKKRTNGQQEPWKYGSLDGDFYFIQPSTAPSSAATANDPANVELTFWNGALLGNNADGFRAYLKQYPAGRFAALAEANVARLSQAQGPDPQALELGYWNRIKDSRESDDFAAYLREFPNGVHVAEARLLQSRAKRSQERSSTTPAEARAQWTAGQIINDCSDCPDLVVIPPGSFNMGSPSSETERFDDEGPQHTVRIAQAFAVGKFEITRGQFSAFVADTSHQVAGCSGYDPAKANWVFSDNRTWRNPGFTQDDRHPAACISWNDAQQYLKWLSTRSGKTYRLLSEAEWEYAARAGSSSARYWGEDAGKACRFANVGDRALSKLYPGWKWEVHDCNDGAAHTSAAGSYQANRFGLYDMLGNVWEWVEDCFHDSYDLAPSDGSAWNSNDCSKRVVRGGSWDFKPQIVRSAYRGKNPPTYRSSSIGFRVARDLAP